MKTEPSPISVAEPQTDDAAGAQSEAAAQPSSTRRAGLDNGVGHVTARAFVLGILLSAVLAGVNTWLETQLDVHFLGGVQLPAGAVFALLFLIVILNGAVRLLARASAAVGHAFPPFKSAELITVYAMVLFAALISTPGTETFFMTLGPALFYYSTSENRWASLFYEYVPRHFAPGFDGKDYQRQVIDPFYIGGLSLGDIPWHAWTVMLIAWGVFMLLVYSTLFFMSLLFRRQWIENEALTFPLVQLPLQMVEATDAGSREGFWANRMMWSGFGLAASFHLLRGLNNYYPDWPVLPSFQGNVFRVVFTEAPLTSIGSIGTEFYFGAIGIAYLLTREMSFSFWFFFLLAKMQLVIATMAGFPPATLPKDPFLGQPLFVHWQNTGAWLMMAGLLLWAARGHFNVVWREAKDPSLAASRNTDPFSARFILIGLFLSCLGLMIWCWYSGINLLAALIFFALYALTSLVLARLVVEGGMLFPQTTFMPLETLTGGLLGAGAIGSGSLAKLSFTQHVLFADMRANILPGFLNTLKMSHDLKLERRDARRLMLSVICAVVVALGVTVFVTVWTIYSAGGLTSYGWFVKAGPEGLFKGAGTLIQSQPGIQIANWFWFGTGAGAVWLMAFARARFLWFPLHPLAFIVSTGYPITRLWFSFFLGWLIKTLLLRFGGQDSAARVRPFMMGLILGNSAAMVGWMLFGFWKGSQIIFWPA